MTGDTTPAWMDAARRAQEPWGAAPLRARLAFLSPLRALLARHADELVAAVDAGRPRDPGDTVAAEILPLAEGCRFLERKAPAILKPRRAGGGLFPLWISRVSVEVRREPFGVVLVLGPSNYPLFLPGMQALQALVAGNAAVLKPGRGGRAAAALLAALAERAGLPAGLFAVLEEADAAGAEAVAAGPDKVILTGGLPTGRAVLAALAPRVVPAVMELSGCDAVFVLPGADLARAARAVAYGMRLNGGATCMGPRRLFVPRALEAEFLRLLETELGALGSLQVDDAAVRRALPLVEDALTRGARQVTGSIRPGEAFRPVLLAGATADMPLLQEDLFCPVAAVVAVEDAGEALRLSSLCPLALSASVFGPEEAAVALAGRIRAGAVTVNDLIVPTAHPAAPFGGRGASGFGVTRGAEGLLELAAPKAVIVRRGGWLPHLGARRPAAEETMRALLAASHGGTLGARLRSWVALWRAARGESGPTAH